MPGTPDGHPQHEGLTAQQRRVLSMALTPDLTPSNVRLLEQELGEDCRPSVTRLKRRWASLAGATLLLCAGRLDLAAADCCASGALLITPHPWWSRQAKAECQLPAVWQRWWMVAYQVGVL